MTSYPAYETERFFANDSEELWDALVDPEKLSLWLGGEVDLDGPVAPGVEGTMIGPDGDRAALIVEHVEHGRRLGFRWATDTEVPSQVWFEIENEDDGVRLRVIERIVPPGLAVTGDPMAGGSGAAWALATR